MPLPCSQNGAFKAKDELNTPTGRFVSLSPGWASEKGSPGQSILLPGKVGRSAQSIGITLPPLPPSSSSPTAPRLKIYINTTRTPLHPPPRFTSLLPFPSHLCHQGQLDGSPGTAPRAAAGSWEHRHLPPVLAPGEQPSWHPLRVPQLPPGMGIPSPSATSSGCWSGGGALPSQTGAASCTPSL